MRLANAVRLALLAISATTICVSLIACSSTQRTAPPPGGDAQGDVDTTDALAAFLAADGQSGDLSEDAIAKLARAHVARINDAKAKEQAAGPRWEAPVQPTIERRTGPVEWIDVSHPSEGRRQKSDKRETEQAKTQSVPVMQLPDPVVQAAAPVSEQPQQMSSHELAVALADAIRRSDDAASVKALQLAALGAVNESASLSDADIRTLDYGHRAFYRAFGTLMRDMSTHAATSDEPLTAKRLSDMVDGLADNEQPLSIRGLKLCRSVSGYGVYEPFEKATFLAGREQPAIVYLELDNFAHREKNEGFEVRLTQEVVLYNAADGLEVWKHPSEEIVDFSRNKRRDFFVVQLVKLPKRLTVGRYNLKVRVTDRHGDTMDAATMPLEIVADQSMVRNR